MNVPSHHDGVRKVMWSAHPEVREGLKEKY